jgi:SAM-dependent methyltransferase
VSGEERRAYDLWHAGLGVDEGGESPWHDLVRARLGEVGEARVLEIGSGRGGFSVWAAGRFRRARVVAADFSRVAVARGREHGSGLGLTNLRFEVGDIQHIAHRNESFDLVISCETVEHVPDPRQALREMARVLTPGGRLLLTAPNYLGLMGLYRVYRRLTGRPFTEVGQPINTVTLLPRTLSWVRGAGLAVEEVASTGHYLPFPGRVPIPMAWPARVPLVRTWCGLHSLVVARKEGRAA